MPEPMDENWEDVYGYVKSKLTAESLKELSLKLIEAYKSKDILKLRLFAESIHEDPPASDEGGSKLFLKLIKHFHPDRLNYFLNDVDDSLNRKDFEKLRFYKNLLSTDLRVDKAYERLFEFDPSEIYRYDEEDFGYSVSDISLSDFEDDLHEVEELFDVIGAVKTAYLGNLDVSLEPEDMASMEGELDLSDFNLYDLEGIQYCRHITGLNLSNNHISNISHIQHLHYLEELFISDNHIINITYLKGLSNLKILDLANNEIEDLSPLLDLENLEFVNLESNPIADRSLIEELGERCVVVG